MTEWQSWITSDKSLGSAKRKIRAIERFSHIDLLSTHQISSAMWPLRQTIHNMTASKSIKENDSRGHRWCHGLHVVSSTLHVAALHIVSVWVLENMFPEREIMKMLFWRDVKSSVRSVARGNRSGHFSAGTSPGSRSHCVSVSGSCC